jgi:hypothetical protein
VVPLGRDNAVVTEIVGAERARTAGFGRLELGLRQASDWYLWGLFGPGPTPELLFCDNETNTARLFGTPGPRYPKGGINDHVVDGAATVNPAARGSKCAAWYWLAVGGGETVEPRLRPSPGGGPDFDDVVAACRAEADEFYSDLTPGAASADEARVLRQAFAGMLWSKQFYHYGPRGRPDPPPPQGRPPTFEVVQRFLTAPAPPPP